MDVGEAGERAFWGKLADPPQGSNKSLLDITNILHFQHVGCSVCKLDNDKTEP